MKYNTGLSPKKIIKNHKAVQIVIPLAYKDEKLGLIKQKDGNNTKYAGPPGRIFHCSVCNVTFKGKSEYNHHMDQHHKKKQKDASSRVTHISKKMKKIKKSMNPAKISDHSGLIIAENRLIKSRFKHSNVASRSSSRAYVTPVTDFYSIMTTSPPLHKKRKINTTFDMMMMADIESDFQRIERTLVESSQESRFEPNMGAITTQVFSSPHPILNDPNYHCRVCHVFHSTEEAYQDHLQTEHHVSSTATSKKKVHIAPTAAAAAGGGGTPAGKMLCKMRPIQVNFDFSEQEHVTDIPPDVDDPNYYCRSCHITKPNRRSYLCHLSMIHKISNKPSKNAK